MIARLLAALALLWLAAAAAPDWTRTVRATPGGGRLVGNPAAKVRLTAYTAYTCPHCAHFAQDATAPLTQAIKSGRLAVEVRPIMFNQIDLAATVIARCVPAARFWAVNALLYASQRQWEPRARQFLIVNADELSRYPLPDRLQELAVQGGVAAAVGLTPAQAATCFADRQLLDDAARATDAAATVATSTPTFTLGPDTYKGLDWAALSTKLRAAGLN